MFACARQDVCSAKTPSAHRFRVQAKDYSIRSSNRVEPHARPRRYDETVLFPFLIGRLIADLCQLARLALKSRAALAAEYLFLRKQLALYQERKAKRSPTSIAIRWTMTGLGEFFAWRDALVIVKPDTFVRWHREAFRLFWRWKSRPSGRPTLPKNIRTLIRKMNRENPTWGEERIADELMLKLRICVSPRTVAN